jgi:hypothetical protein
VAYLIEGFALHPGDSFTLAPDHARPEVLFLTASAPWLKVAEAVDYLRQVGAPIAVPIHDAVLSDPGKMLHDQVISALAGDTQYRRLTPGEELTLISLTTSSKPQQLSVIPRRPRRPRGLGRDSSNAMTIKIDRPRCT